MASGVPGNTEGIKHTPVLTKVPKDQKNKGWYKVALAISILVLAGGVISLAFSLHLPPGVGTFVGIPASGVGILATAGGIVFSAYKLYLANQARFELDIEEDESADSEHRAFPDTEGTS